MNNYLGVLPQFLTRSKTLTGCTGVPSSWWCLLALISADVHGMLMRRWAFKGRYQRRMYFLLYKHFVGCNAGIVTSLPNAESVDLHYTKCVPVRYTTPLCSAWHCLASFRVSPRGCFAEERRREEKTGRKVPFW